MQRLKLTQTLTQKLSAQQIQFLKLLQVPTIELDTKIREEIENNPVLEEGREEEVPDNQNNEFEEPENNSMEEINIGNYIHQDDISGYKMQGDGPDPNNEEKEFPIPAIQSLPDSLINQLDYLNINEKEHIIGIQLIGSIDRNGYIRREIEAIVNDLAFLQNIKTNYQSVEKILKKIQNFDPPGIAARDLQECLFLQLKREKETDSKIVNIAIQIVIKCFQFFKKKHYDKIQKKLDISERELQIAINLITKLNPKPGNLDQSPSKTQYITPDFIVKEIDGKLKAILNSKNVTELKISRSYSKILEKYNRNQVKDKKLLQAVNFVKKKLDSAKWFIDAIKQRQETLLKVMYAIIDHQKEFFISREEGKLKPMILRDIAEKINMNISTISRVTNNKFVQTDFGLFHLKFFFSETVVTTESGKDISSKEVKYVLKKLVSQENKKIPLSDEKLEDSLKEKGYFIARRTIAKYRKQLGIPVARLRRNV